MADEAALTNRLGENGRKDTAANFDLHRLALRLIYLTCLCEPGNKALFLMVLYLLTKRHL